MRLIDFPGTPEEKQKIRAHQEKIATLLKNAHSFFQREKYTYFVDGGTLLGAVRHEGFIPWDDDVDLLLMKKDFDRLKKAVKKNADLGKSLGLQFGLSQWDKHYVGISPLGSQRDYIDIYCFERFRFGALFKLLIKIYKILFSFVLHYRSAGYLPNQYKKNKRLFLTVNNFKKIIQRKKYSFLYPIRKIIYPFAFLMFFLLNIFLLTTLFLISCLIQLFCVSESGRYVHARNWSSFGADFLRDILCYEDIFPLAKLKFENFEVIAPIIFYDRFIRIISTCHLMKAEYPNILILNNHPD